MNILYISTKDPRLTNGGNEQRTHFLWEALKSMGTVYTFMPNLSQSKTNELIEGEHPIYMCKPIYSCQKEFVFSNINWNKVNELVDIKKKESIHFLKNNIR